MNIENTSMTSNTTLTLTSVLETMKKAGIKETKTNKFLAILDAEQKRKKPLANTLKAIAPGI